METTICIYIYYIYRYILWWLHYDDHIMIGSDYDFEYVYIYGELWSYHSILMMIIIIYYNHGGIVWWGLLRWLCSLSYDYYGNKVGRLLCSYDFPARQLHSAKKLVEITIENGGFLKLGGVSPSHHAFQYLSEVIVIYDLDNLIHDFYILI